MNGSTALLAPKLLMRRVDVEANRAAVYGLRMFGVRKLLIGLELLSSDRVVRDRAVRLAPLIHDSDTVGAAIAGVRGDLSRRSAVMTTAISGANLVSVPGSVAARLTAGVASLG